MSELIYNGPELIIVDGHMPCLGGVEALYLARKAFQDIPFIMLYEADSPFLAAEALMEGASACLAMNKLSKIKPLMAEVQSQHPEHKLHITSRRIVQQIKDNIAGLDQIRNFLQDMTHAEADLSPSVIKEEIDISIDYLEQLEDKMRTKAA
ncbi:MAG: response regulator [Bacteroidota bacterium]